MATRPKCKTQLTLLDSWGLTPSTAKKQAVDNDSATGEESASESIDDESERESQMDGSQSSSLTDSHTESSLSESGGLCTGICCSNESKPFQPNGDELSCLTKNSRKFLSLWFKQYPWLTVCLTAKKVYCFYCKYAMKHKWLSFSNCKAANPAFVRDGFNNWKKAHNRFCSHSTSNLHKESQLKWVAQGKPSLPQYFSSQLAQLQETRRNALICQLSGLRFLLRQGLAIRGHSEMEGNLRQLLRMYSSFCDMKAWLKENRYMSHDIINEQITIMGNTLLRTLLCCIKKSDPAWYAIIADEASDVANKEQFYLSIRWVSDDYTVKKTL